MADPLPFDDLYERYRDRVFRFCVTQVRDVPVAEDLTADVFVAAYAAYERTSPDPDGVHLWLFRIAKNLAHNHRRRLRRWNEVLASLRGNQRSDDVENTAGVRAELREVLAAMTGLRRRDQMLVGLRVAGGLSYAEIGELVGMTEHAATVATGRALERLRLAAGGRR